jgi:hypothetical protein
MIDLSKKYRMRDDDNTVLVTLGNGWAGEYPILATLRSKVTGAEFCRSYTRNGYYHLSEVESPYDLIEIKEEEMLVSVTDEIVDSIAESIDKRLSALCKKNRQPYNHPGTINIATLIKLKLGLSVLDKDRAALEKYFPEKHSIEIQLNDSYTAVVSKDTVKVGCQEFPVSKLKELIEAHSSI